ISTVQDGLVVDTEVTASADHRMVSATVRADFTIAGGMRQVTVPGGAQVEAPELAALQWRTTTPIPNGGAVLLTA
ncbi:hypothetical protein, partial [Klebsiella pneumoniae]|uniref:hypothetical protein n=1 Tax=Klebsiella pneumoniae TaxID=573 RepID=UPI0013301429